MATTRRLNKKQVAADVACSILGHAPNPSFRLRRFTSPPGAWYWISRCARCKVEIRIQLRDMRGRSESYEP